MFANNRCATGVILQVTKQLYKVEADCKTSTAEEQRSMRQQLSVPLLKELKRLLDEQARVALPKSPLMSAVQYTLNQWDTLNVLVTDGDLTIGNNLAENALRPIALGRKNWMFLGHESGGQTLAVISA